MSVTQTLHDELARRRAAGYTFNQAWPHAARAALLTACDVDEWEATLVATRDCWERAYNREPAPRHELACGVLHNRTEGIPIPEGPHCTLCSAPTEGRRNQKYCRPCKRELDRQRDIEYSRARSAARREALAA